MEAVPPASQGRQNECAHSSLGAEVWLRVLGCTLLVISVLADMPHSRQLLGELPVGHRIGEGTRTHGLRTG